MTQILLGGALRGPLREAILGHGGGAETELKGETWYRLDATQVDVARLQVWAQVTGIDWDTSPTGEAMLNAKSGDPIDVALAEEIFRLWPGRPVDELVRRRTGLEVRAQARLNAEASGPTTLRHRALPNDVTIAELRQPYGAFFSVEEYDLTHRTFSGGRSERLTRAAFISGDAVVVLPYDPERDRVLLVEQFRTGPLARGDAQPWSLEAVAGRIDARETPEAAARREAVEEAGLNLGALISLGGTYPSPGAMAEYLYNFVAVCDLPDDMARTGGLATEGEDIRLHLITFEQLLDLIDSGEVDNGPLVTIALMLDRRRAALRGTANSA